MKIEMVSLGKYSFNGIKVNCYQIGTVIDSTKGYDEATLCEYFLRTNKAIVIEMDKELIEEKPTIKPQVTKVVEPQVKKTRKYNKKNK